MFGHERGAFTDARQQKRGLLEQADEGTVFLDEIGEMTPALQAKLLRVLETKRFRRVMDTSERSSDFRLAAATAADLEQLVAEGRFRADLIFRLKVAELAVPPLRERREDVLMLAAQVLRSEAGPLARLSPAATSALAAHSWPGNVRELANEMKRASVLIGPDGVVHAAMLSMAPAVAHHAPRRLLDEVSVREKELIEAALRRNGGHRDRTARELAISRRWLQKLIKLHGL
jgi:transcriptional regulator with PAS, ATPase and Fis domain